MPKETLVTCKCCGKKIIKDSAYKVGKVSYYCNELCYQKKVNEQKKAKDKYKAKDPSDRLYLTDYIQELYLNEGYDKSEIPWTLITARLKNIMEEYGFSYNGIRYTLWYCYEIAKIDLFSDKSNTVLWAVPFEYKNAEKYWCQCEDIRESVEKFDFNEEVIIMNKKKVDKIKQISFD